MRIADLFRSNVDKADRCGINSALRFLRPRWPRQYDPDRIELSGPMNDFKNYPLLTALCERRSRRFGLGMKMPAGPLAFESRFAPVPPTEEEVAALVFAASRITGHALAA